MTSDLWPCPDEYGRKYRQSEVATNAIEIRLEKDGDGQSIHIPAELALSGETAMLLREGRRLILEQYDRPKKNLRDVLRDLPRPGEDIGEIDELPHRPVNL